MNRYTDLNFSNSADDIEEAVRNHYFRFGFWEGRHPFCARPMTAF